VSLEEITEGALVTPDMIPFGKLGQAEISATGYCKYNGKINT
jgi:hypothetical protein